MFNFTQTVSPDVIDITPMVIMAIFSLICSMTSGAMLSYDATDARKKMIATLIGTVLLAAGFVLMGCIITNSIDAGIEWQKLRM